MKKNVYVAMITLFLGYGNVVISSEERVSAVTGGEDHSGKPVFDYGRYKKEFAEHVVKLRAVKPDLPQEVRSSSSDQDLIDRLGRGKPDSDTQHLILRHRDAHVEDIRDVINQLTTENVRMVEGSYFSKLDPQYQVEIAHSIVLAQQEFPFEILEISKKMQIQGISYIAILPKIILRTDRFKRVNLKTFIENYPFSSTARNFLKETYIASITDRGAALAIVSSVVLTAIIMGSIIYGVEALIPDSKRYKPRRNY